MKSFHIHEMSDSSVLALTELRDKLNLSPEYQRPGGVWSLKKKQLFIDSLLNGYDIPKLYFHHLTGQYASKKHDYAIIDGRQRLEAIWDFIDGRLALGEDFKFFENEDFNAAGMTFPQIQEEYPRLLIRFHARSLAVMVVTADDLDFIEDMFSRLNEAVPLNAAEKRNALGGPLPKIIKEIAAHSFFTQKVPFPATRYRHYDVAAKLLVEQHAKGVVDTKKARLDYFVIENRDKKKEDFAALEKATKRVLDRMVKIFSDDDPLLRSSGMVVVYYTLLAKKFVASVSRSDLLKFEKAREKNREKFEREEKDVNFAWIEYDELAQSANDGAAIKSRAETLAAYLKAL
ncbi:MAG: DUF262 domain-containing protein [Bacillota bacterium]